MRTKNIIDILQTDALSVVLDYLYPPIVNVNGRSIPKSEYFKMCIQTVDASVDIDKKISYKLFDASPINVIELAIKLDHDVSRYAKHGIITEEQWEVMKKLQKQPKLMEILKTNSWKNIVQVMTVPHVIESIING